jgi:hypothetical protein
MSTIKRLLDSYQRFVSLPWSANPSGRERVWCVVYPPDQERALRVHLGHFRAATLAASHEWSDSDLTHRFALWLDTLDYRDTYFEAPEAIPSTMQGFRDALAEDLRAKIHTVGPSAVLALHGVAGLFGALRVSDLLDEISGQIPGRLVVFFPGTHHNGVYRLLDARDGWNYLATAITADNTDAT